MLVVNVLRFLFVFLPFLWYNNTKTDNNLIANERKYDLPAVEQVQGKKQCTDLSGYQQYQHRRPRQMSLSSQLDSTQIQVKPSALENDLDKVNVESVRPRKYRAVSWITLTARARRLRSFLSRPKYPLQVYVKPARRRKGALLRWDVFTGMMAWISPVMLFVLIGGDDKKKGM